MQQRRYPRHRLPDPLHIRIRSFTVTSDNQGQTGKCLPERADSYTHSSESQLVEMDADHASPCAASSQVVGLVESGHPSNESTGVSRELGGAPGTPRQSSPNCDTTCYPWMPWTQTTPLAL